MKTLQLWSYLILYLGIGVILGSSLLLMSENYNTALGVGGLLAIIGAGLLVFHLRRSK